jgi:hypothetical protein
MMRLIRLFSFLVNLIKIPVHTVQLLYRCLTVIKLHQEKEIKKKLHKCTQTLRCKLSVESFGYLVDIPDY